MENRHIDWKRNIVGNESNPWFKFHEPNDLRVDSTGVDSLPETADMVREEEEMLYQMKRNLTSEEWEEYDSLKNSEAQLTDKDIIMNILGSKDEGGVMRASDRGKVWSQMRATPQEV